MRASPSSTAASTSPTPPSRPDLRPAAALRPGPSALSLRTWLSGLVLAAACTAPPPPPPQPTAAPLPPPTTTVGVAVVAPEMPAAMVEALIAAPIEDALAGLPDVRALASRADDGLVQIAVVLPATPDAFSVVRAALPLADLPSDAWTPTVFDAAPVDAAAVVILTDSPDLTPSVLTAIQRRHGVGRVEACGGGEPRGQIDLDLDRVTAAAPGVDVVLDAIERAVHDLRGPPALEDMSELALGPAGLKLRDVAVIRRTLAPRPCFDPRAPDAVTLVVSPQHGADPRRVADGVLEVAAELAVPPRAFPAPGDLLATFALELDPAAAPALDACLRAVPVVRDHALVAPRPAAGPALDRATLHVAAAAVPAAPATPGQPAPQPTFPIEPVREALSACTGVLRVAAVAPHSQADVALTIEVLGPDPSALAELAARAAAVAHARAEVTLARVLAGAPAPGLDLRVDRQAAAALGVDLRTIGQAARLALGPVDLDARTDLPIRVDIPDRPDAPALFARLMASSPQGPRPLSSLVTLAATPPTLRPRYRVDRRPAALVELRLRRADGRDALDAALRELSRPDGVELRLGATLPVDLP